MDFPIFGGMAKTQMLFYFESMIIFARNAAYVYGDILFNIRIEVSIS